MDLAPQRSTHADFALEPFLEAFRSVHGQDLSRFNEGFLRRSLHRLAGPSSTLDAYLRRVIAVRADAEHLVRSLDIHHSEWFRDPLAFALLERRILPDLVALHQRRGGTEIRVWSAGCAAGQEALSVAILLNDLAESRVHPVSFRIFATDTSEAQLALARSATYPEAMLRNVPFKHLTRWFARQGDAWVVSPDLLQHVHFSVNDLLDEASTCPPASIFGAFDLVLCCNLLYYYTAEHQQKVLRKLKRNLTPDGTLMTSDTERDLVHAAGFRTVAAPAALFVQAGER